MVTLSKFTASYNKGFLGMIDSRKRIETLWCPGSSGAEWQKLKDLEHEIESTERTKTEIAKREWMVEAVPVTWHLFSPQDGRLELFQVSPELFANSTWSKPSAHSH